MINNKPTISSTAETNKNVATKIISLTTEEKQPDCNYDVFYNDTCDVANSRSMVEGI